MKYSATVFLALTIALSGCGGGGETASAPNPVPSPAPTPSPSPTPAAMDVIFMGSPGSTQEYPTFTAGDALRIRYNAELRRYEVMAPGHGWDSLYGHSTFGAGSYRMPGPMEDLGSVWAQTRPDHADPAMRFQYSSLASWTRGPGDSSSPEQQTGVIAFGVPTPAGGVPLTGSASYVGPIAGSASIPAKSGWGDQARAPINGTVALNFDFGSSTLSGEIRPRLACDCDWIDFPTLAFADTSVAAASGTYSGRFATAVPGPNAFSGLFTGPGAQELIGRWALPFMHEGAAQSAEGAWVAKKN